MHSSLRVQLFLFCLTNEAETNSLKLNETFDCCCSCLDCYCWCFSDFSDGCFFLPWLFVQFDSDDEHMLLIIMYYALHSHIIWFPSGLFSTYFWWLWPASVTNTFHICCCCYFFPPLPACFACTVHSFDCTLLWKKINKFVPLRAYWLACAN